MGGCILCHMTSHDVMTCMCSKLAARHRDTNKLNRTLKKRLSDLQALQRKMANTRSCLPSLDIMLLRCYCHRLPHTNPNISASQCDVEVMIHEELSDEKRTARMKKVNVWMWYIHQTNGYCTG